MDGYVVDCKDRRGHQHMATFDYNDNHKVSVLRHGWQEAIRLCGSITFVASATVRTIDGRVIGSLR